jgi:hypothetical protein
MGGEPVALNSSHSLAGIAAGRYGFAVPSHTQVEDRRSPKSAIRSQRASLRKRLSCMPPCSYGAWAVPSSDMPQRYRPPRGDSPHTADIPIRRRSLALA